MLGAVLPQSTTSDSQSTLRVLVLSHNFPHPADPGEAAFVARGLQALAAAGVRFHILSPTPRAPHVPGISKRTARALKQSRLKPARWDLHGLAIEYPRYLKLPGRLDWGLHGPLYARAIRRRVQQLHQEAPFDLVHGQWLLPDGYAAAILGADLGIPSVSSERGYVARCHRRKSLLYPTRTAIESVDHVISVSQFLADRIRETGTPRGEVTVIRTPLNLNRFTPQEPAAARANLKLPPGQYILSAARAEPVKCPLLAVQAFARLAASHSQTRLIWLGDGSQLPDVREAARQSGVADRVLTPGNVAHETMPQWLAAANIVLLTSRDEGLPNTLVEAAAMARPIVATNVGGVSEIVLDGKTGFLAPRNDADALATSLDRILTDPELAVEFGQAGRKHVVANFGVERFVQETLAVYRQVLSRK